MAAGKQAELPIRLPKKVSLSFSLAQVKGSGRPKEHGEAGRQASGHMWYFGAFTMSLAEDGAPPGEASCVPPGRPGRTWR